MSFHTALQAAIKAARKRYSNEHPYFSSESILAVEQLQADFQEGDDENQLIRVLVCFCCDMPESGNPAYDVLMVALGHVGVGVKYGTKMDSKHVEAVFAIIRELYSAGQLNQQNLNWLREQYNRVPLNEEARTRFIHFFKDVMEKVGRHLTPYVLNVVVKHCHENQERADCFASIVHKLGDLLHENDINELVGYFSEPIFLTLYSSFCALDKTGCDRLIQAQWLKLILKEGRQSQRFNTLIQMVSYFEDESIRAYITEAILQERYHFSDLTEGVLKWAEISGVVACEQLVDEVLINLQIIVSSNFPGSIGNAFYYLSRYNLLTPENRALVVNNHVWRDQFLSFVEAVEQHWPSERLPQLFDQRLLNSLILRCEEPNAIPKIIEAIAKRYEIVTNEDLKQLLEVTPPVQRLLLTEEAHVALWDDEEFSSLVLRRPPFNRGRQNPPQFVGVLMLAQELNEMQGVNQASFKMALMLRGLNFETAENLQKLQEICLLGAANTAWQLRCIENLGYVFDRAYIETMLNRIFELAPILMHMDVEMNDEGKAYMQAILRNKPADAEIIETRAEDFQKAQRQYCECVLKVKSVAELEQRELQTAVNYLAEHESHDGLRPLPLMVLDSFCLEDAQVQAAGLQVDPVRVSELISGFFARRNFNHDAACQILRNMMRGANSENTPENAKDDTEINSFQK